jgi:valyl-tRNA synthetase
MPLPARYDPASAEPELDARWQQLGIYQFERDSAAPCYSIDTPPPTVSGRLHLGHVYSYSHTDFLARFFRMNGYNVYYPMGFDDNGLPTERLVEKTRGVTAPEVGRAAFIRLCLEASEEAEKDYRMLWQRLGLSIDWRYTYRSIDTLSRRTSQRSFLDLYKAGRIYRAKAPALWCPECRTSIAQAELDDLDRETTFYTLAFSLENGATLPIATTRPELLPACVAIFVPPDNARFAALIGAHASVPLFGRSVPILADPQAQAEKGTGAVMCCTFGDTTDVEWWRAHSLPLRIAIGRDGRMTEMAGPLAGMTISEARRAVVPLLADRGLLLATRPAQQSVRTHERCGTPVEYIIASQWFVRVLDQKGEWLAAGERVAWHPEQMRARYRSWIEGLRFDWNLSRQRYFGVPFPVWYCDACGEALLATEDELPVDPTERGPSRPCPCGGTSFMPDSDVMDTWATSSMSPQIAGRWLADPELYAQVFPYSLRPQAHEIIRTWAFYTLVKSRYEFDALPWTHVAISGWGLAPPEEGTSAKGGKPSKLSKSKGGSGALEMVTAFSADAVRYWAASTGFGKDTIISEEKIALGAKLVTKLWNVARFAERFLAGYSPPAAPPSDLAPTDRWLLARLHRLIERVGALWQGYEYAAAKSETEAFFWRELADNYLELAKARLYAPAAPGHEAARYTLHAAALATVKLFAPILPYVTDAIYTGLFAETDGAVSVHRAAWPQVDRALIDEAAEQTGEALVAIATAVRRHKSEANLSLGAELPRLELRTADAGLATALYAALADLGSVTRAREIAVRGEVGESGEHGGTRIETPAGTIAVRVVTT